MRPGIWYLVLAFAYLGISCWSLYFVCTMYAAVVDTLCKSSEFVDTVNVGYATDPTWIGVQHLGKQIYVFTEESTLTQANYREVFAAHGETVDGLPAEKTAIDDNIAAMSPKFSVMTVQNFETATGLSTTSTLTELQDGTFGPYNEEGTITNSFYASA